MNKNISTPPLPSDTFCIKPFLEMNVTPTGAVKACCVFTPSISHNGREMSVYDHSVEEIWNSDAMRSVRRKMIEGKLVDECAYCYRQERIGALSTRIQASQQWASGIENPRSETYEDMKANALASDFRLPAGPEWLELQVGNLCNLKCRMCHNFSSSSIANDPVHSRWGFDYEAPARWQGRVMVVAPTRVFGVEYEGLSAVDRSGDAPLAWMSGAATIRMKRAAGEVSSIQIKLVGGAAQPSPIEIFANDVSVYCGELSDTALEQTIELPKQVADAGELSLRMECPARVGIEELKLLRTQTGTSKVGFSRFSSGKQWFNDEDFLFNDLMYKVHNLTRITLYGGEPFLIKEVRSVMKYLISQGVANNITLHMATNGTIADDETCDLAAQFKCVSCAVSLDGVGAVNDYIRHPSRWTSIEPNIRRLQQIKNAYVYVNMVVQAYNMFHVCAVAQYCEDMDLDFTYHFLDSPPYLSSLVMPEEARKAAAHKIRSFAMRNSPDKSVRVRRILEIKDTLLGLADLLESNDKPADPKLLDEFMVFTNDLDASRDQDFGSIDGELRDFIEASGVRWNKQTRFAM